MAATAAAAATTATATRAAAVSVTAADHFFINDDVSPVIVPVEDEQSLRLLMRKFKKDRRSLREEDDGAPIARCMIEQRIKKALSLSCNKSNRVAQHVPDDLIDIFESIVNNGEWRNKN